MQNAKHVSGAFDSKWFMLYHSFCLQVMFLSPASMARRQGKADVFSAQKDQGIVIKNKTVESHFKSLNAYHFSALPGSFLSLLQSLFGFHVCFLILHCFSQQLHCRNRPPALRSYGNEMITYLLIFWDGSYFIKGN